MIHGPTGRMSKTSRLARPPSGAGSKLPSPRKECSGTGARSRVLSVGEKLMRAGGDGILRQKSLTVAAPLDKSQSENETQDSSQEDKGDNMEGTLPKSRISPPKVSRQHTCTSNKQTKSNLKLTSPDDTEHVSRRQTSPNGTNSSRGDAKNSRPVSRRHTLGGARGSKEILAMQPSDMDKKREAFLEHLKHKYPHHASAIMGHQERLRDQSRSPKHGPSPQPCVGDQVDHISLASLDSLDAMSEGDTPTAFTRGSRVRASLPVVRSTNQTKDRSLGVLYLQYGDETKQIRMPNEITSIDTVRALFVSAFPQQLNMKMLESPSVAVYVKDDMRNVYYELSDVRNITDHSCLKVYHKDPAQAFSHGPRPTNGDARMHSDMVHPGPHPLRPMGPPPHHPMQGALPPTPHSMPPSPSRIPFGPRQASIPGSATMPRDRLSNASTPVRSISPCPSAILERRDVKPDDNMPNKSHSLSRANEGIYADPYMLHGPHPSPGLDGPEHGMGGFHRASIRSTGSYSGPSPTDTIDHPSLYRQKSRNSQLPTLGSKTPPPSPHRMAEVRMIDIHGVPPHAVPPHAVPPHAVPPHAVPIERGSPVRQSFRKEDVAGAKARGNMSPVVTDAPGHHPGGPIPAPNDHQTRERMKAMEQQIASLTGLVQHALFKGPNTSGTKESISERPSKTSSPAHNTQSSAPGGSPVLVPKTPTAPPDKVPIKVNLLQFRKNVSDLRIQLHQMRQLQLQNQEALRVQLKRAEQEISVKLTEAMQRLEDPAQRQRAAVEEDRHKYLSLEERVLTQLSDLEQYVGSLQKDSTATQRTVTLKDVEEGAVTLRKVGESLAGLKGEFPALQTRMRAVLRVEVEAVKFLKEEPHKLDGMLKRVKTLTDTLSGLRKCATEGSQKGPGVANVPVADIAPSTETFTESPPASVNPNSTSSATPEAQNSTIKSGVMPSSPMVIHQVQSSPVQMQQSQQSAALITQPSPPHTPNAPSPNPTKGEDRNSPKGPIVEPPTNKKANGNPASNGNVHKDMVIGELQNSPEKSKNRALSIKAAEKEWEERRQNMGHYDGKEFEKILQEAQANMMKGIPNLGVEENQPIVSATSTATVEQPDTPATVESPTEESKSSDSNTEKTPKKAPEKLPKPAKPTLERSSRVNSEQPPIMRQTSKENGTKTGSEKAQKSPPPPPPRKTYSSSSSGMTTTRSGEVVYTRKESLSSQEVDEQPPSPAPQASPKSPKVPPETKPKPTTPPPVIAPAPAPASSLAPKEEEEEVDEGDKIMAELQVFQKYSVKEVEVKNLVEPASPRIEPQIKELRPGTLLPLKEKKTSETNREEKDPDIDENANTMVRQSQGVIYYVTGQIPKEPPPPAPGQEDTPEPREPPPQPSSQVSNVNLNTGSSEQHQLQQQQPQQQPKSPTAITPPPISPKPAGLNGFKLPRKNMKRSESLKTSTEMEKGNIRNKINNEKKKEKVVQERAKAVITQNLTIVNSEISAKVVSEERVPPKGNYENEEASLSPDLPGEEAPPPPDNIAFMITNTKVQALSNGEYQELVNAKKGSVQTVTVGNAGSKPNSPVDSSAPQDNGFNNKKPVIIIFDEPMDIRSAYKRLSTIFECEEELERMLAEERIDEESEESDSDRTGGQEVKGEDAEVVDRKKSKSLQSNADQSLSSSSSSSINEISDSGGNIESGGDGKDSKKKFKFKFPKKQLAALTQAIRAGTKSGKKTLQVVVYEDEEESDGTVRQHKEAKRFEISRSKSLAEKSEKSGVPQLKKQNSESLYRTDEIRKNTYKTLDSLEQTIKQLETTISEMGPLSPDETVSTEDSYGKGKSSDGGLKRSSSLPASRGSGPKVPLKSALKKPKPQLLPRPVGVPITTTTSTTTTPAPPPSDPSDPSAPIQQNTTSVASPTSRMPVPLSTKSRQSSTEKAGKQQQKLQDAQRQFRQANGSAKRVGGDHKTTSPTIPVSKIPAFYPSSTKSGSSQCAPDATNPINPSNSSTSSKSSMLSAHNSRSLSLPSSHIPSLSNGSLKQSSQQQHTGKALSFSSQNGRMVQSSSSSSSSSSSTPSPLSPTPLGPAGKSIRTIHTPSFNSYRAHHHNGNSSSAGKSCIPTAAKDAA